MNTSSDGTPADRLTEANFSRPICLFNADPDDVSWWNSIWLTDRYLYLATATNRKEGASGTVLKRAAWSDLG